jgi:hypothetical protein
MIRQNASLRGGVGKLGWGRGGGAVFRIYTLQVRGRAEGAWYTGSVVEEGRQKVVRLLLGEDMQRKI